MIQNRVIRYALWTSKIIKGACLILGVAFLVLVAHWHISPLSYDSVEVSEAFRPGYGVNGFRLKLGDKIIPDTGTKLSKLPSLMIYWLLLRAVIFVGLTWLMIGVAQKILKSISSFETFHQNNVVQFRVLARYGLIAFIFSCFNFSYLNESLDVYFQITWSPLLLMISSYVLAEVFREGNRLREEQKLII